MSAVIRAAIVLVLASASAFADGDARVVLADTDPELVRAIRAALAPWHMQVSVDGETTTSLLTARADARFVVWREHGELVVFDRERDRAERREAPAGPLDPVSAAAAALTVKTLMRLPPPAETGTSAAAVSGGAETPPPTPTPPTAIGVQAGGAVRRAGGTFGGVTGVAVVVKPPLPLRLGIAGEYASEVDAAGSAGFKGTWRDWAVLGIAGWALELTPRWALEPHAGIGVRRFVLDGRESMMTERHERETLFVMRGGVFARARFGRFGAGASASADVSVGTPTYTKAGTSSEVYAVPPFALSIGMFIAAEL